MDLAVVTHCTVFAVFVLAFGTIDPLGTCLVFTIVAQTERVARSNIKLFDLIRISYRVFFSRALLGDGFELAIHPIKSGVSGSFYLLSGFGPCYVRLIVTSCP
jgi:hypothetical protein